MQAGAADKWPESAGAYSHTRNVAGLEYRRGFSRRGRRRTNTRVAAWKAPKRVLPRLRVQPLDIRPQHRVAGSADHRNPRCMRPVVKRRQVRSESRTRKRRQMMQSQAQCNCAWFCPTSLWEAPRSNQRSSQNRTGTSFWVRRPPDLPKNRASRFEYLRKNKIDALRAPAISLRLDIGNPSTHVPAAALLACAH